MKPEKKIIPDRVSQYEKYMDYRGKYIAIGSSDMKILAAGRTPSEVLRAIKNTNKESACVVYVPRRAERYML